MLGELTIDRPVVDLIASLYSCRKGELYASRELAP